MRGAPLNIIPSDPLPIFLLPVSSLLCSADLDVLVPDAGILPPGDKKFNWKLRLSPAHFELLMPLYQQAKRGVTVLAGVNLSKSC